MDRIERELRQKQSTKQKIKRKGLDEVEKMKVRETSAQLKELVSPKFQYNLMKKHYMKPSKLAEQKGK